MSSLFPTWGNRVARFQSRARDAVARADDNPGDPHESLGKRRLDTDAPKKTICTCPQRPRQA